MKTRHIIGLITLGAGIAIAISGYQIRSNQTDSSATKKGNRYMAIGVMLAVVGILMRLK